MYLLVFIRPLTFLSVIQFSKDVKEYVPDSSLKKGKYRYPFKWKLSGKLPPSFSSSVNGKIQYEIGGNLIGLIKTHILIAQLQTRSKLRHSSTVAVSILGTKGSQPLPLRTFFDLSQLILTSQRLALSIAFIIGIALVWS